MRAALADRFAADVVTVLATDGLALSKTKEFATLLFGSPKAARDGVRTLVVYSPDEDATGETLERYGRNLPRVAVTHTGALDVKDVLGYGRLVLTTGALEALSAAFAPQKASA